MDKLKRYVLAPALAAIFAFAVSAIYPAYGHLGIEIIVPSSAEVGDTILVQVIIDAPVHRRDLPSYPRVYDVRTALVLPEGAVMTSDVNETLIGVVCDGDSFQAKWNVAFEKNGTHYLRVHVSGFAEGSEYERFSTTHIVVSEGSKTPTLNEIFLSALPPVLGGVAVVSIALVGSLLILRNRKNGKSVDTAPSNQTSPTDENP